MRGLLAIFAICLFLWGSKGGFAECRNRLSFETQARVLEVRPPVAVIKTPRGEILYLRLGPYRFWLKKGYRLRAGEKIFIRGYRCGRLVFPQKIQHPRGTIILRDERGFPLWRKSPPRMREW